MTGQPFDADTYRGQAEPSRRSADVVLPLVIRLLRPSSVLDLGCGVGAWLAAARTLGVTDIVGIEGGHPSDEDLQVERTVIRSLDLREPIELGQSFDLAISVEAAEHLPAQTRHAYYETLSRHTDAILFSAAVPGQGGAHHVNEQWPSYWADDLAAYGFECFDPWRLALWDDTRIEWWYRQNVLLFARGDAADRARGAGMTAAPPVSLVHPELYRQTLAVAQASPGIRESAHYLAAAIRQRVRRSGLVGRRWST